MNAAPTARRRSGRPSGNLAGCPYNPRDGLLLRHVPLLLPARRPPRLLPRSRAGSATRCCSLASLVFYTWGAGCFVLVLIGSIARTTSFGLRVERAGDAGGQRGAPRRSWRSRSCSTSACSRGSSTRTSPSTRSTALLGPAGVGGAPVDRRSCCRSGSRSTRSTRSATSSTSTAARRATCSIPIDFALYIAFFPQLDRRPDRPVPRDPRPAGRPDRVGRHRSPPGVYRFCHGLGKKVLIADTVAPIAERRVRDPDRRAQRPRRPSSGSSPTRSSSTSTSAATATWRSGSR